MFFHISSLFETLFPLSDASVKQAEWDDDSKVREKLHRDIEAHSSSVRGKKLSEIAVNYEVHCLTNGIVHQCSFCSRHFSKEASTPS